MIDEQIKANRSAMMPLSLTQGGIVAGGYTGGIGGAVSLCGVMMQQNQNALYAFDFLYKQMLAENKKIARIIEIGTASGGLSVFMNILAINTGAEFYTYDIDESRLMYRNLFDKLGTNYIVGDIWDRVEEVGNMIASPGLSWVLCDGGDKAREVNVFSKYLKTGDFIFAHDYAPSNEYFEKHLRGKFWGGSEIRDEHVADVCKQYGLNPMYQELFVKAVWMCRQKQ